MTTDAPTRRERYGRAAVSGQLRHKPDAAGDLDTIAAAGLAGIREPLGITVWRAKYANDRHAYRHAVSLLVAKVANTARKRHWREQPKTLKLLSFKVFDWLVFGVCPACQGRGHLSVAAIDATGGRGVLHDDLCPNCHGVGSIPIERSVPVEHIGRAKDIAQLLAESDQMIDARMWAKLGQRVLAIVKG